MHEVLVNRLGGLSLSRKSVVRSTDRPDMTLDVYRGRKTTIQQQQSFWCFELGSGSKRLQVNTRAQGFPSSHLKPNGTKKTTDKDTRQGLYDVAWTWNKLKNNLKEWKPNSAEIHVATSKKKRKILPGKGYL